MSEEMNISPAEQENMNNTVSPVAEESVAAEQTAPRRPGRPKGSKNKRIGMDNPSTGPQARMEEKQEENISSAPAMAEEEPINMENVRPDALVAPANAVSAPMNAVSFGPPEDDDEDD